MLLPVRFSRQYALASWPESALVSECSWRTTLSVGALAERLAFLWHINKCDSNPDLLLGGGQHFDRVAIDNTRYARADRLLLQVAGVRGGFGPSWPRTARAPKRKSRAMSLACMRRIALPASGLRPFPSWQPWRGAVCGPHLQPDKMPRRS
jgi:hypothetical protein